jgi:hypothetical protein
MHFADYAAVPGDLQAKLTTEYAKLAHDEHWKDAS